MQTRGTGYTTPTATQSPTKRPTRVQEKLTAKITRGAAAQRFKQEHGGRKWLTKFVHETWGCQPGSAGYARLTQVVYKSIAANALDAKEDLLQRPGQGRVAAGHRSTVVSPKHRVRAGSQTRNNVKMVELGHELFQWWVDMAETLQARVPTDTIIAQALIIIEDAQQFVDACIAQGIQPPDLTVPEDITRVWVCRWRKSNSLTPKCITCSYTVSFVKKLNRLGVTWRNATRLLVWHELLFGPGHLTFMSIDEKPYRFNAAGGDKVWSRRGQRSVKCKEKRVALLERWTGITAVFSQIYGESASDKKWQPKWAALFKATDGSRCDVVSPDESVQVLFAPHGSVDTPIWKKYLEFALPVVDNPKEAVIMTTDWYAPHLAKECRELVVRRTLSPDLFLGGGTTGQGAVCDKTPHRILALTYKKIEGRDHMKALLLRPKQLPKWTKQDVLRRGYEAWQKLDHECGFLLHRSHGYTTAIEGENDLIDSSISQFWHHEKLHMPTCRPNLKLEIIAMRDAGIITDWADAHVFMEEQDDHRAVQVGAEGGLERTESDCDEPEDDDTDGDDDDSDHGDDDAGGASRCLSGRIDDAGEEAEEDASDQPSSDKDASAGGGGAPGDEGGDGGESACQAVEVVACSSARPGGPPAETVHEEAVRILEAEGGSEKRAKLEQAAALLDSVGEISHASEVRATLRKLRRKHAAGDTKLSVALKSATVRRWRDAEGERSAVADSDRRMKEMKAAEKIFNLQRDVARAKARDSHTAFKLADLNRKTSNEAKKALVAREARNDEVVGRTYASYVAVQLKKLSHLQRKGMELALHRRRKSAFPKQLPRCWPKNYDKKQLRSISVHQSKSATPAFASQAFTWHLFEEKRPQALTPLHADPVHRLRLLFDRCLPGWKLFETRYTPLDMLVLCDQCADAAFLNMVSIYKRQCGHKDFPPGVFDWPPTDWLAKQFHTKSETVPISIVTEETGEAACKRRRLSCKTTDSGSPMPATSSSSSSSSCPAASSASSAAAVPGCQPSLSRSTLAAKGSGSTKAATSTSISSTTRPAPSCASPVAVVPGRHPCRPRSTVPPAAKHSRTAVGRSLERGETSMSALSITDKWSTDNRL